jgi:hypothetical protein
LHVLCVDDVPVQRQILARYLQVRSNSGIGNLMRCRVMVASRRKWETDSKRWTRSRRLASSPHRQHRQMKAAHAGARGPRLTTNVRPPRQAENKASVRARRALFRLWLGRRLDACPRSELTSQVQRLVKSSKMGVRSAPAVRCSIY